MGSEKPWHQRISWFAVADEELLLEVFPAEVDDGGADLIRLRIERGVEVDHLLVEDGLHHRGGAKAAVLGGPADADPTFRTEPAAEGHGIVEILIAVGVLTGGDAWRQLPLDKLADLAAEGVVFGSEAVVQLGPPKAAALQ